MKLSLRTSLKAFVLALGISTALSMPVQAEPITATLFGSAFAATFGGQIVSMVIGTAASWIGGQIINWLFPPATNSAETTTNTTPDPMEVRFGERVYRSAFFGVQALGGHWVHANEYSNAKELQLIYVLADGWIDGTINAVKVNGRSYTLVSQTPTNNAHREYTVDTFGSLIRIRVHDGRPGQAADTNMVAQTAGWTSAKKFTNMAYVAVEITSDRDKFNGPPDLVFVARGLKCYDPRKDSTAPGGSGSHRFNDPTTWEYTLNPAVQAYHFSRGFYANGFRVLGAGYPAASISYEHAITAMNVCDETVSIPGGGTRKRYECHTSFDDGESYGSVMDRLCQAMGGHYNERQGQICIWAGAAKSTVLTITDGDLIVDEDYIFDEKVAGETLVSAIQGTYTHPTDFFDTPYTALYPPEFVYSGMEPRTQDMNLPQVQHPHQAYLLAKQKLFRWQLQASASIVLDIKDILVEIGDWIRWTSSNYAVGDRIYEVITTGYDFKRSRMRLGLAEISADVFDDDSTAGDIVVPERTMPITSYINAVSSLQVDPVDLLGSDGSRLPGLKVTYAPIFDPAITGVRFAYRVKGTTEPIKYAIDPSPNDGAFYLSDFLVPGKRYEVNAQIIGIPGRTYEYLPSWVEASGDTNTIVATRALTADAYGTVNLVSLGDDVRELIRYMNADYRQLLSEVRDLTHYVGEADSNNTFKFDGLNRSLAIGLGDLSATFDETITLRIIPIEDDIQVIATSVTELSARVDTVEADFNETITVTIAQIDEDITALADALTTLSAASVDGDVQTANFRMTTLTGPSGYTRIGAETRQGGTGVYRGAAWYLDTPNNDALPTRMVINAQQFIITDGTSVENPFVFSSGVAVMNASRVNLIQAGRLESFNGASYIDLNTNDVRFGTL